jgi:hypothetical protein
MLSELAHVKSNHGHTYRLSFQGTLNSPKVDWCGDVIITLQEYGGQLLVSLIVDPATLCSYLDQFGYLNLTILPDKCETTQVDEQNNDIEAESQWITTDNSILEYSQLDSKEN